MNGRKRKNSRTVSIEGHEIELTNLEKVLFPEPGITKWQFIEYYGRMAPVMLPLIKGRAVTLHRFPGGPEEEKFYQKKAPSYFPEWINRVEVDLEGEDKKEGGKIGAGPHGRRKRKQMTMITIENKATLVYLANLACIPHVWLSLADEKARYPDRMAFDLDPPGNNNGGRGFFDFFEPVRYAALILREVLRQAAIEPYVMTTGSRGLHVVVPLDRQADFRETRDFAARIAELCAEMAPEHFTAEFVKRKREGRLFIDTYRNAYAQTAVAPYAVRAKSGAPVAAPVDWQEVEDRRFKLSASKYTIKNIFARLGRRGDPWKEMGKEAKTYSVREAAGKMGF
ncbi:MAG: hypothetical protein M0Z75_05890 [Nitrospiraceae bacterium]|nr:hypothetical protein [Nitrospiraceae bacterium]